LQVRQCADGISEDESAVIENFLEFGGGFRALMQVQVSLART